MQTSTAPAASAALPRPANGAQGCYKCGKPGHWAKDCTAPQSEWISRGNSTRGNVPPAPNSDAQAPRVDDENVPAPLNNQVPGALKPAKQKKPRPKVTLELLQHQSGLPDIFHNFPEVFRTSFKGKGHEGSDLRRLLEMYKRWQDRVFPHCEFDMFINKVEALSGTNRLKHELQEMRTGILRVTQEAVHEREREMHEKEAREREQAAAVLPLSQPAAAAAAAHVLGDDDDDLDLDLALDDDDDDERMEMMMMMMPGGEAGRNTTTTTNDDDDDDLDLDLIPTQQDDDTLHIIIINNDDDRQEEEVPMTMMATQDIVAAAFAGLEDDNTNNTNIDGGEDEVVLDDEELLAMAMADIDD